MDGLMTVCHDARKGRYIGSHWPNHVAPPLHSTSREVIGLMRDKKRADLDTDRTLGLTTLRCLEIVGEAASHIPESLRQQHPQIPWPQIIGTRNRLVHGYELAGMV